MGSAEDEINDNVARFAKLRPMRVEMHGRIRTDYKTKLTTIIRSRDVACNVFETHQFQ